jgi:hypothetical protein
VGQAIVLVIRESQLAQLRRVRIQHFVDAMVEYLTGEYPTQCAALGAREVRAFIERTIAAGARIGVDTEGAIGVLTELRLVYGEQFERAPDREWALNILAHQRLPGYIKVEAVQNRLSEKTGGRSLVEFRAPS